MFHPGQVGWGLARRPLGLTFGGETGETYESTSVLNIWCNIIVRNV